MNRWNPLGIPRENLSWALTQKRIVQSAIQEDSCLLCASHAVNESGLCEVCYALLDENELRLAVKWLSGEGAL